MPAMTEQPPSQADRIRLAGRAQQGFNGTVAGMNVQKFIGVQRHDVIRRLQFGQLKRLIISPVAVAACAGIDVIGDRSGIGQSG